MAKLQPAERLELKGAMVRIAHAILNIDMNMKPSLHDRVEEIRARENYTDKDIEDMYDKYVEEVAEEYIQRIERD